MTRGILFGLVLAMFCVCGLAALVVASSAFLVLASRSVSTPSSPIVIPPVITPLPPMTESPTTVATPASNADLEIDPQTRAMLAEIEMQVRDLRGLQPNGEYDLRFPTPDEYRQHVTEEFEQDYTPAEAEDDVRLLAAIGLLPQGFDLYNLYLDLYTEQILGSYDQESKEMFVLKVSGKIGGVERQTYAHEYDHALQDQNYGLEALGLSDESCEKDTERCMAIRGLVEGDATLLDTQWLDNFGTSQDYADINEFYDGYTSPAYDRTPCYLRDDFYWPYDDGLAFVQSLYDSGGWAAVDDAYRNPPVSTEQIMHPELYRQGDVPEVLPTPVLTDTLGAGWRQIDANVMGEWYTRLILLEPFRNLDQTSSDYCQAQPRVAQQMVEAAAGWGGDAYVASYNEATGQTVFVMLTTWDTDEDAREFADAFVEYGDARWGTRGERRDAGRCWIAGDYGVSCFWRRDTDSLWVIAPDDQLVERILEQLSPFGSR